jgi:hypothetical protein
MRTTPSWLALVATALAACSPPNSDPLARIDHLPEPTITDSTRILQEPMFGELPATVAYETLKTWGDEEDAAAVEDAILKRGSDVAFSELALASPKPYQYTDHVFGYIAPPAAGPSVPSLPIVDAHSITADLTLQNAALRITLDRLRVFDYPGGGIHHVLFDFSAEHQATPNEKETPHFNHTYRVQEGGQAGISGYPIFVGLRAGTQGIHFAASTVNVKNDDDQRFLGFISGDLFKGGLTLLSSVNPAVPVVAGFVKGIAEGIATHNNNKAMQDVYLGLDFETVATRPKLRVGSYIVIQVPSAAAWDWTKWQFSYSNGQIVDAANASDPVPFNYFVISISKM